MLRVAKSRTVGWILLLLLLLLSAGCDEIYPTGVGPGVQGTWAVSKVDGKPAYAYGFILPTGDYLNPTAYLRFNRGFSGQVVGVYYIINTHGVSRSVQQQAGTFTYSGGKWSGTVKLNAYGRSVSGAVRMGLENDNLNKDYMTIANQTIDIGGGEQVTVNMELYR